jgi:hypothetical protein
MYVPKVVVVKKYLVAVYAGTPTVASMAKYVSPKTGIGFKGISDSLVSSSPKISWPIEYKKST